MQPYFYPFIGYLQLINSVDTFVLYEHVTFRKRTWINRNRILDKGSGKPIYITVPVKHGSSFNKISEIHISSDFAWREKIINLIKFNYKKAPYFADIFPKIEESLEYSCVKIHDLNCQILRFWCATLGLDTNIVTEVEESAIENALDERASKNQIEPKTQRVVDICNHFKKSHYINPSGGTELYSKSDFQRLGLDLNFINPQIPAYAQFDFNHTPYLSMIDTLMHLGTVQTKQLIQDVRLI
ncbi:MAG: WbqC family protein [Marinoscillum sp.]